MENTQSPHKLPSSAPFLISFSGMDGSGKSTQIERLASDLANAGLTVKRMQFWDNVVAFSSMRAGFSKRVLQSDGEVGSPDKPANRNDKNAKKWYLTLGRHVLYFFDAVKLRQVTSRILSSDVDVIIFDRYLYDQLATLPLQRSITRSYANFLLKLVPKPNVAFVIDAVPEVARARKPEYPLDFMHRYRSAYLQLSQMAGLTVIPPSGIEEAHTAIITTLESRMRRGISSTSIPSEIPA